MPEPRARVVEVTKLVPPQDVPYIAARVAERLGMPLERVRKLIDGRTGPITKPLRPDKADAIAQTFEAAGVVVVIRTATEEDELQYAPRSPAPEPPEPTAAASDSEAAPDTAVTAPEEDASEQPSPGAEPSRFEEPSTATSAASMEEASDEAVAEGAALSDASAPRVRSASGAASGWEDSEARAEVPPEHDEVDETEQPYESEEPAATDEVVEPEDSLALDEPVEAEAPEGPLELDEDVEPEESFELDEAVAAEAPEASYDLDAPAEPHEPEESYEFDEPEERAEPAEPEAPEASFEPDESAEPGDGQEPYAPEEERLPGAAATGPAEGLVDGTVIVVPEDDNGPTLEHAGLVAPEAEVVPPPRLLLEPVDDDDETNEPGPYGIAARGEVVMALPHAATGEFSAAAGEEHPEDREVDDAAPADGDEDAETRPPSAGTSLDAGQPFGDPSTWQAGEEAAAGWRIGPRAGRRLEVVKEEEATVAELSETAPPPLHEAADEDGDEVDAEQAAVAEGEDAPTVVERTRAVFPPRPRGPGPPEGVEERRAVPGLGRESRVPRPPAAAPSRPPDPVRSEVEDEAEATTVRAVPTAWRGLGGEERGPARPPDARLPRREPDPDDEIAERPEATVGRRRLILLAILVLALIAFFFVQVWAAGRAAPSFDAGLHRFRDADFAAAQRVWSQLASAGDPNAQFMLGYLSEAGLGRPWSARAAASWYRLAADAGHAEAQWRLANLYARGLGVPHEPSAAERWWSVASDAGHAEAAFSLARSRLEGATGGSDVASALVAFERAAVLGWPAAAPYRDALLTAVSVQPHTGALP